MWRGINSKKGKLLIAGAVLVFTFGSVSYGGHSYREWTKWTEDSVLAMTWSGFGPEKGLYNFTVVTALVDIGRGSWGSQSRSYNTYLLYMQRVLRLDVNMVIFVDQQGKPFIDWMRRGRENRTQIIVTRFKDVPYYRLRERIAEIMESAEYRQDNQLVDKHLCESYIPEYDILQLSKLYFMDRVARENPFDNSYFMWIDAGYGHGQDVHPVDGVWIPHGLFEYPNQITFLERTPGVNVFASKKSKLHKLSINIVAGNFFAGGGEVFKTVYELQKKEVDQWMERGIIDDDQTMYMYLYYRRPDLFHLVPGDWNDVFKFFNSAQR